MEEWQQYPCDIDTRVPGSNGYVITAHYKNSKVIKWSTAPRDSWEKFNNKIVPVDKVICHRCNNKLCKQPQHLYAGTHEENMQDRAKVWKPLGELNSNSRLTDKQRIAIRRLVKLGFSYEVIANDFHITKATVCRTVRNSHGRLTDLTEA